jgi:8-oxo-dGTP pyrophosphatase MutT (NUDIX family)
MLHLIPRPLHRAVLRCAHLLRGAWWRLNGSQVTGCRLIALDPQGRVLLVRHSYGSGRWMPPGGGLRKGEDAISAAQRELREETGCSLLAPRLVTIAEEKLHGARHVVHIVGGEVRDKPQVDGREVIKAAFFRPEALPKEMPQHLRVRMRGWITAAIAARPADAAALPPLPQAPTA